MPDFPPIGHKGIGADAPPPPPREEPPRWRGTKGATGKPGQSVFFPQHGQPTGAVRLRVGWFGRVTLEEEVSQKFPLYLAGGDRASSWELHSYWRRVERGRVFPVLRPTNG